MDTFVVHSCFIEFCGNFGFSTVIFQFGLFLRQSSFAKAAAILNVRVSNKYLCVCFDTQTFHNQVNDELGCVEYYITLPDRCLICCSNIYCWKYFVVLCKIQWMCQWICAQLYFLLEQQTNKHTHWNFIGWIEVYF